METPLLLGPDASLLGILNQSEDCVRPDFALLMFNAGVLSRIGPHRMNVKLARALGTSGVTSLRFDLSGQGDSRSSEHGADARASAVNDIVAAMNHLQEQFGIVRFALFGICSGAVQAFSAALADQRIVGLMMFDGYWYRSRWSRAVRHWKRLRSLSARQIASKVWGFPRRVFAPAPAATPQLFDAQLLPPNPPREEFIRSMQTLVDRRVVTHFVYSGTVIEFYSYAAQFRHAFGRERFFSAVRCDFCPDVDHTFASLESQQRMIGLVLDWIDTVGRQSEPPTMR